MPGQDRRGRKRVIFLASEAEDNTCPRDFDKHSSMGSMSLPLTN